MKELRVIDIYEGIERFLSKEINFYSEANRVAGEELRKIGENKLSFLDRKIEERNVIRRTKKIIKITKVNQAYRDIYLVDNYDNFVLSEELIEELDSLLKVAEEEDFKKIIVILNDEIRKMDATANKELDAKINYCQNLLEDLKLKNTKFEIGRYSSRDNEKITFERALLRLRNFNQQSIKSNTYYPNFKEKREIKIDIFQKIELDDIILMKDNEAFPENRALLKIYNNREKIEKAYIDINRLQILIRIIISLTTVINMSPQIASDKLMKELGKQLVDAKKELGEQKKFIDKFNINSLKYEISKMKDSENLNKNLEAKRLLEEKKELISKRNIFATSSFPEINEHDAQQGTISIEQESTKQKEIDVHVDYLKYRASLPKEENGVGFLDFVANNNSISSDTKNRLSQRSR